jgi:hypothetical protein
MSSLQRLPTRPRFVPELTLPSYSYVPGRSPHPFSDARGHSYGGKPALPAAMDAAAWQACRPYLYGIDLFNHGYYWEAHEVWEGLWKACGRRGVTADVLKGLIKLAAAGVKLREGRRAGVVSHSQRAATLFRQVKGQSASVSGQYVGLNLDDLARLAETVAERAKTETLPSGPEAQFDFLLCPS